MAKERPELLDRLTKKLTAWQQSIPDIKYDNPNRLGKKRK